MSNFLRPSALAALLAVSFNAVHAQESGPRLPAVTVSEELTIARQEIPVLETTMSYLEEGKGDPVVFLHGNPTSAYLWRNVIPFVSATHRAIAPDLIGMGHSGKPDLDYTFQDHARHLDAFVDALGLTEITLVGHDWGAALAWDFARRHPDMVVRLAFMEGLLPPAFPQASYEAMGEEMGDMFRDMRDPEQGRQMIMEDNMFVEGILPMMVNRPLGDAAAAEYRAPYETVESRLPTWMWPREVPIGGEPTSSVQLLNDIGTFMGETEMPVLLAYAEPGALVPPQAVPFYTGLIDDLETAFVGQGLHFIQEDQPVAIGRAISDWLRRN
ncbi:haloalkane dehalogenase [Jannaschia faecimaris]|uniref:Haloalkane dehalogenase n=1 Tax=Jannaschia faecimaris TaxID=1244108 RepID=A0A1H3SQY7_9RHOB|nr:haloalkane dehalogenase [Jannaschia faecimaris]SDZ39985.1 haloalkane dehalogenase [Jannaschia faecimaris]